MKSMSVTHKSNDVHGALKEKHKRPSNFSASRSNVREAVLSQRINLSNPLIVFQIHSWSPCPFKYPLETIFTSGHHVIVIKQLTDINCSDQTGIVKYKDEEQSTKKKKKKKKST